MLMGYTYDTLMLFSSSVPVNTSGEEGVPLPAVVVPAAVLIMLIFLVCVAICVVHKFRRQEPTMYVTKSSVIFRSMCFTFSI